MTFEKVLEVFSDYLTGDKSSEVFRSSRGCIVVNWENCLQNDWVTGQFCSTPEDLQDILRLSYVEYQSLRLIDDYKRDLTEQEYQDIEHMGLELAARCEKNEQSYPYKKRTGSGNLGIVITQ